MHTIPSTSCCQGPANIEGFEVSGCTAPPRFFRDRPRSEPIPSVRCCPLNRNATFRRTTRYVTYSMSYVSTSSTHFDAAPHNQRHCRGVRISLLSNYFQWLRLIGPSERRTDPGCGV